MERNNDKGLPTPAERQRQREERLFCESLMAALARLQQLKEGLYHPAADVWLEGARDSFIAGSALRMPRPYTMRIDIPPEVVCHTSENNIQDPQRPEFFIARQVQRLDPLQVEFTEQQGDPHNVHGKWLIVNDNFDKLTINPWS